MPSQEFLNARLGATWTLHHPQLAPVEVKLVHVGTAGSMSKHYVCYNAEFEVADGTRPPSLTYRARCEDQEWDLLFNAIGPGEEGLELLQLVIHTKK